MLTACRGCMPLRAAEDLPWLMPPGENTGMEALVTYLSYSCTERKYSEGAAELCPPVSSCICASRLHLRL